MPQIGRSIEFLAVIDALKASTTLSTVVSNTLPLTKHGHEFLALCPFHTENTPSFTVNDAKGFYHCFGCGAHGDVFDWLEHKQNLTLKAAVKFLGGAAPDNEEGDADPTWEPMVPPPDGSPRPDLTGFDLAYVYCDQDGSPLFYVRRRNASDSRRKQFIPLTFGKLNGKTGWHARHPTAPRPLYGLDRLARRPNDRVLICEGEKAADAASRLLQSFVCVSWPAGTANVGSADWSVLANRDVIIWPDNDPPGSKAAAEILTYVPRAKILRVDDLPAKSDAADVELDDPEAWIHDRLTELTRRRKANGHDHALPPPFELPGKPVVRVLNGLRHIAADAGMDAMTKAGVPFYQRDKTMVRAALSKAKTSDGAVVEVPSLVVVVPAMLARALGQCAEWEKVLKTGEVIRIDPPKEVVEQIAAMVGHWPFAPISGVISTPTMRPDGSLLTKPGYDEATGLVLINPPPMPPIPDKPTRAHAEASLARINGLLFGFPFSGDASRAAALSMLLTPVLRGALGGAVPMHVVAAPQPGTGKSYLQDVASVLATGERCAVITVAPDPNETEKRLIGAALAGFPIIALDNCNGVLTGDFLAQVTERPLLQLRPLGGSGIHRIPNVFSVFANGNNIAVSADLVRRTILTSLDANMESPETREFEFDPVAEILERRGDFLSDCLIIARAYHCAFYPERLPRVPSFERWSDVVRSALVWLGMEDPVSNSDVIKADDPDRSSRAAVFSAWSGPLTLGTCYSTGDVIAEAEAFDGNMFVNSGLRAALLDVAKSRTSDRIDPKRLGWWCRNACKVVIGNRKLTREYDKNTDTVRWKMDRLQS